MSTLVRCLPGKISILPVLETKFEGREFDYLGQLIVTPNNGSYENKRYEG